MYHLTSDFNEGVLEAAMFEMETAELHLYNLNTPGPNDDDDDEEEEEVDSEESNTEEDEPALDKDVVHSPVPTDTGGRGKK